MKLWRVIGAFTPFLATAPAFPLDQSAVQAAESEGGLQEVVVTAQKRTENIQNVPISIVAFTGDDLKKLGMTEAFDIANQVPNMNIDKEYGDSAVRYFIRGVGTQDFASLATSPVAVYVDDVFLGSTIGNSVNLFDMERVEVLLGPQGTLWGKNTTGGAINYISAHPTQTFAATVAGGFGNFGDRDAEGMVNIPITSTLAARAAITYSGQNSWVTNLAPDGPHNLEAYNKAGARLSFQWTPSEALTMYLKGDYLKRTGSSMTVHMVPLTGTTNAYGNPLLPQDVVNQAGGPNSDDFQTWDVTLRFDWSIASFLKFVSISAWQNSDRIHEYEIDGGTPFILFNGAFFADHDQFTQEFRLASDSGRFRWQTGIFYYYARESAMTAAPFNLAVFGAPPGFITTDLWPERRKWNSGAVFGGVEYDLVPQLTVKGGLRYNEDEGSFHADHYGVNPYANYLNYLDPNPQADPNATFVPADTLDAHKNWTKLTWDAGLTYRFAENKMAYFTASTGYRQGTFSTPSGGNTAGFNILEPETNRAFEIGAKTSWMDGKLRVNAAAFNYDYTNMQVFALRGIVAGAPLSPIQENAGKAENRGGELQLEAAPTKDWLITTGVGYVHAVFTEFNTFTPAGEPLSLAGNRFPRQPKWTSNALLQYRLHVWNSASIELQTDWNYRGDYYVNPNNAANPYIPGRTIGNVRATYSPANDRWSVALWAKNVTDKIYPIGGYRIRFANSDIFYEGYPLTYGIYAQIKF